MAKVIKLQNDDDYIRLRIHDLMAEMDRQQLEVLHTFASELRADDVADALRLKQQHEDNAAKHELNAAWSARYKAWLKSSGKKHAHALQHEYLKIEPHPFPDVFASLCRVMKCSRK